MREQPQPLPHEREALLRRLVLAIALEPRPGSILQKLRPAPQGAWTRRRPPPRRR